VRRARAAAVLVVLAVAAGATSLTRAEAVAAPAASGVACSGARIGFLGPLTGEAAFIGKEQLGFARYAIRTHARGLKLVEGDTQLRPARAAAVARRLHADRSVLAVVGPAGSQEVLAVAPVFGEAPSMPFVSGSATRAVLTNGSIRSFFRVVPHDGRQAPTIAAFVRRGLKARRVVVVDDRSTYSRPLASGVEARLRAAGIRVVRRSAAPRAADFSGLVAQVPADTDVVFLPWRTAAHAQRLAEQLLEQRPRAVVVGADALDSRDFRVPGAYVAGFAPDVRGIAGNEAFVSGYGARFVSNFGPPLYVATQAVLVALRTACADGTASRAEVSKELRRVDLPRVVLGGGLRFTANGDVKGGKFSIFRLEPGGRKKLAG
jgi:branched-chain amino acid transport system substrate-binding protein